MRAAERKSTEECPVKMKLIAPPLYVLTTNVRVIVRFPARAAIFTYRHHVDVPALL